MTYQSELRETVLTLDVERMRELDRRWFGIVSPVNDAAMLSVMHKIRLHLNGIPEIERDLSLEWLTEHGYSPPIRFNGEWTTSGTDSADSKCGSLLAPIGPPCS